MELFNVAFKFLMNYESYTALPFVVSFIEHYVLTSKFNHVFTWSSHFADANDIPFYFLDFIF